MKSSQKGIKCGDAFDQYFSRIYGSRWGGIRAALLDNENKIARRNRFFVEEDYATQKYGIGAELGFPKDCFEILESFDLAHFDSPILPFYRMDPASVVAARALQAQPGEQVLDMCAAPGGKSLVIAEDLAGAGECSGLDTSGRLVANEMSAKRRFRLMSVFKRYLPLEVRQMVHIRGVDGSRIGLERKEAFDRILLDAPCSGERGVINKKSELEGWKEKRSKSFAIRQYALLSSAFMALRSGGRIVYSTCSISPYENDGVISKLMQRHVDKFTIARQEIPNSDPTEFGTQFLPDHNGWGPIFFCVINKN